MGMTIENVSGLGALGSLGISNLALFVQSQNLLICLDGWFDFMGIKVVDPKTGEYPDLEEVILNEDWAKGLIYCDVEGFAITEDGYLILMDECGNFAYVPDDRFNVFFEELS